MHRLTSLLALTLVLAFGCREPFAVDEAALTGSLGELEGFDRTPDTLGGWNTANGDSVVQLRSDADDGSVVMTRLTVGGGFAAAALHPEDAQLSLLGCSGPDGYYTFDRTTSDVQIEVEPTDDPVIRVVHYWGEFTYEERAQVVEGRFRYRVVADDTGATVLE